MLKPTLRRYLVGLASLRLTAAGFMILGLGLVAHHEFEALAPWTILLPIGLLAVNLAAALLVDQRFRGRPALFGFHVCLLVLAGLAAWGKLASVHGRLIAIEGLRLDPDQVEVVSSGPWAPDLAAIGDLSQGPLRVDYAAGLDRRSTASELHVPGSGWRVVGDDVPLVHRGFRLYTTPNKGFAAIITWIPDAGAPQAGSIGFPSFPARQIMQQVDWRTPGAEDVRLRLETPLVETAGHWTLAQTLIADAAVEVQVADRRQRLLPGQQMALSGGSIRLERVALWVGYRLTYIPGLVWLLSTAMIATVLMAIHVMLPPSKRRPVQIEVPATGGTLCQ